MHTELSVVIVTYNSKHLIDRCLAPIIDRPSTQIIVWDNQSVDGTAAYVRSRYPNVTVVDSPENRGFAAGNNAAFNLAVGEYLLLLNPDAFLPSAGVLDILVCELEAEPSLGIVGPQLLHANGAHQVGDCGWRLRLLNLIGHFLFLNRILGWFPGYYLSNPTLLRRRHVDVDWVCGACLLTRRRIIAEVGGLDETSFMYGEDVEWGERIRDAGYGVRYLPQVRVTHLQGGTQRSLDQTFASTKWLDAMARRVKQTFPAWKFVIFKCALISGLLLRAGLIWISAVTGKPGQRATRARVLADYARHVLTL